MDSQLIDGVLISELENRMYPGGWSKEGFLAQGQSLIQVMADDHAVLQELGVSPKVIGETIEQLLERGRSGDPFQPAQVEQFLVRMTHSHKMRTCPWAPRQFEWCRFGKGVKHLTTEEFVITNSHLGESLNGSSLCIHLIRDHKFFGGPGTAYRINPIQAVRVLELQHA